MPDANGVEFVADLRARDPRVRLILITAYELTERETQLVRAVDADLLIKPVTADVLALHCGGARVWSVRPAP